MLMKSLLLGSAAFLPLFNAAGEGAPDDPPAGDSADGSAEGHGAAAEADDAAGTAGHGAAAAGDGAKPDEEKPPMVAAENWRDREIRRKHAQLQESKRREAEKDAELEALRAIAARTGGDAGEDSPAKPAAPAAKPGAIPQELRDQALAQVRFDESANSADKSGRERYGDDWKAVTGTLELKGGFDIETMNGILATDDPAKVLYELGKHPDRYDEVMALPPYKRLAEMVKISLKPDAKPKGEPKPSEAEPPPNSIKARQSVDTTTLRDDLPDEDWYARRAEQKKRRHEARQAGRA